MGSIDYGTQTLTFDYKEIATSQGFNTLNYKLIPTGIYSGGLLTRSSDVLVDVAPLVCYIEDKGGGNLGVRIETAVSVSISVSPATPYVILRFLWANVDNVYADIMTVAQADLLSTDLILGVCLFDGSVMRTVFDYTLRDFRNALTVATGIDYDKPDYISRGDINLSIINNTTSLSVEANSYVEIMNMYIRYTQNIVITGTPTGSATNYFYIEKDTNGVITYTTVAPVWNSTYGGWYDSGGTKRYIGSCYYDGTNFSKVINYKKMGVEELASFYKSTSSDKGASTIGVEDSGGNFTSSEVEAVLAEIIATLASTATGKGASTIGVEDSGGLITATNVEDALQEIYSNLSKYFPIGSIMMFDGTGWVDNSTITGWYACIAANAGVGAPDMVDKFVMGKVVAGSGAAGGSNTLIDHTHTVGSQSASHTHATVIGSHYHNAIIGKDIATSDLYYIAGFSAAQEVSTPGGFLGYAYKTTSVVADTAWTSNTDLGTKISGNQSASHTHTVGSGSAPGSTDSRPSFYSMLFIRKCA